MTRIFEDPKQLIGISGRSDLVKPRKALCATINTDDEAYKAAKTRSVVSKRLNKVEEDVKSLHEKMDQILGILQNGTR